MDRLGGGTLVSILIEPGPRTELLSWLESRMGGLVEVFRAENLVIYHGSAPQSEGAITIQANKDASHGEIRSFTDIRFNCATPWESDMECARDAYANLGWSTMCDPGPEFRCPGDWLLIDHDGERVVCLDQDDDDE